MRAHVREIEEFFSGYQDAFSRGDRRAIASHFGQTVHVTTDTGIGVRTAFFGAADEWQAVIGELVASYREIGVSRGELRRLHVMPLSARLAQATARWAIRGPGETKLYEFDALYTLAEEAGAWRIVALVHDELSSRHAPMSKRER